MVLRGALKWSNQEIGNFFGDFKDDRELNKEAGVWRVIIRVLCLLCLLGGSAFAFYLLFMETSNIRVERVYLDGKDSDFAISRLYNSTASYGTNISEVTVTEKEVIDCPCTRTTISWVEYVHFYTINSTYINPESGIPIMNYNKTAYTVMLQSSRPGNLQEIVGKDELSRYISRDKDDLTPDKFCNNTMIWPAAFYTDRVRTLNCLSAVTTILTTTPSEDPYVASNNKMTSSWSDPRASYFDSLSLLDQKFLYSNTLRRLRAHQREQYTLQMSQPPDVAAGQNETMKAMFMSGMSDLWLDALDAFGWNSSSTDVEMFIFSANRVHDRFYTLDQFFGQFFVVLLFEGNTFLGMDVNWLEYYNACKPAFCDVTTQNTAFRRTYTTLAQVGGLWGYAVVALTLVVWPVIAFLLARFSRCSKSRKLSRYTSLQKPKVNAEIST